jgi:hypothetical protein
VRVEEFGLGFAAVASLGIPPAGAVGVELCARGAFDCYAVAFDLEEGAGPFFVAPGCGSFEDDLHTAVSISPPSVLLVVVEIVDLRWCHPRGHSGRG